MRKTIFLLFTGLLLSNGFGFGMEQKARYYTLDDEVVFDNDDVDTVFTEVKSDKRKRRETHVSKKSDELQKSYTRIMNDWEKDQLAKQAKMGTLVATRELQSDPIDSVPVWKREPFLHTWGEFIKFLCCPCRYCYESLVELCCYGEYDEI